MDTMDRRQLLRQAAMLGAGFAITPAWRGAGGGNRFVARSSLAAPRGVHLSFTQDARRTTTATWFTDGLQDPGSVVEFGPVEGGMTPADIRSAPLPFTAEGSAAQAPGVEALTHEATMIGLTPGGEVRYRVGRPDAWSAVRTFAPAPAGRKFTFAHVGDYGLTADSRATTGFLAARRPDLVLVAGDLAYANGTQPVWDAWFDAIEPLAASVPLMAAPGNHEAKDFGGQTFKARMSHPGAESFYSFDYANIAFVVSTAGVFLADGTIAQELAEMDLALANAAVRRAAGEIDFIAVLQHNPLWTDHESRGPLNPSLVAVEEQILQRHQVDLLLVGHDHFYERSLRMAYGQPGAAGYVQVISGGGGQSLYDFVPPEAFQSWSAAHHKRFHCVLYEVDGGQITGRVYATDVPGGELLDTFDVRSRRPAQLEVVPARSREAIAAELPADLSFSRRTLALSDLE